MAGFDGNGNYVRPYNWTNDAANGLTIDATKFDTDGNDVATAFGICLTRDGQGKPSGTLDWAQLLNLTKGSDGAVFSVGRTGGTNNPLLTFSVTEAGGLATLNVTGVTSSLLLQTASAKGLAISAASVGTLWEGTFNVGSAAMMQLATTETGSFTGTATGMSDAVAPTCTCVYSRTGNLASIQVPGVNGTSNTTSFAITGLPANLQPARSQRCYAVIVDAGVAQAGMVDVHNGTGTITFFMGTPLTNTGFTNSGLKGASVFSFTYSLV